MVVSGRDIDLAKGEDLASEVQVGSGSEWPRHRSRQGRGPGNEDAGALEVI